MQARFLLFLALTLGLSGCYLAEGAADLVKMTSKASSSSSSSSNDGAQPQAMPQAATKEEEPPPPLPQADQSATSVKVEELPPPQ